MEVTKKQKRQTLQYSYSRGEEVSACHWFPLFISYFSFSRCNTSPFIDPSVPTEYCRSLDNDKLSQLSIRHECSVTQIPLGGNLQYMLELEVMQSTGRKREYERRLWMQSDILAFPQETAQPDTEELCEPWLSVSLSFRKRSAVSRCNCAINAIDRLNKNPRQTA